MLFTLSIAKREPQAGTEISFIDVVRLRFLSIYTEILHFDRLPRNGRDGRAISFILQTGAPSRLKKKRILEFPLLLDTLAKQFLLLLVSSCPLLCPALR